MVFEHRDLYRDIDKTTSNGSGLLRGSLYGRWNNGFFVFSHGNPVGSGELTGWKSHISVKYEDIERATDIIATAAERFHIVEFKVTDPKFSLLHTDDARGQSGKVFTLTHTDRNNWSAAFNHIEKEFKRLSIRPGPLVKGDRGLRGSQFIYYRNDGSKGRDGTYRAAAALAHLPEEQRYNPENLPDPFDGLTIGSTLSKLWDRLKVKARHLLPTVPIKAISTTAMAAVTAGIPIGIGADYQKPHQPTAQSSPWIDPPSITEHLKGPHPKNIHSKNSVDLPHHTRAVDVTPWIDPPQMPLYQQSQRSLNTTQGVGIDKPHLKVSAETAAWVDPPRMNLDQITADRREPAKMMVPSVLDPVPHVPSSLAADSPLKMGSNNRDRASKLAIDQDHKPSSQDSVDRSDGALIGSPRSRRRTKKQYAILSGNASQEGPDKTSTPVDKPLISSYAAALKRHGRVVP